MKVLKKMLFPQYLVLIALFGLGIIKIVGAWDLKVVLILSSYCGLALSVAIMRKEIQELREQLRDFRDE